MVWETKDQIAYEFMDKGLKLLLKRGFVSLDTCTALLLEIDKNVENNKD